MPSDRYVAAPADASRITPAAETSSRVGAEVDPVGRVTAAIQQAAIARSPAPVGGGAEPARGNGFVMPGRSSTGTTKPVAGRHTSATPGKIDLLSPADAPLVQATIQALRQSPVGAPVLDSLVNYGVRIKVLSDEEFAGRGLDGAGAWFNTAEDVMYLRRSWLEKNPGATASALAHEAVHAIDDASGLLQGAREAAARRLAQTPGMSQQVVETQVRQTMWELSIAAEARAFLVQGQVLRDLGQVERASAGGAIAVAAAGGNDYATYDRVFQTLVREGGSAYNPEGRSARTSAM